MDCTSNYSPLQRTSWQRTKILLTHWDDQAANMLEKMAWAAYRPTPDLPQWTCSPECNFFETPSHIRVVERVVTGSVALHIPVQYGAALDALLIRDVASDTTVLAFRGTESSDIGQWALNIDVADWKTTKYCLGLRFDKDESFASGLSLRQGELFTTMLTGVDTSLASECTLVMEHDVIISIMDQGAAQVFD